MKNYWDAHHVDKYRDFSVINLYILKIDVQGLVSVCPLFFFPLSFHVSAEMKQPNSFVDYMNPF